MRWEQEQRKRIYNEIAGIIMSWSNQNKINLEEMNLLLNLLDEMAIYRRYPDLQQVLKKWLTVKLDDKLNEIILATLIAVDFKNPQEIENLVLIIEEFIDQIRK